MIDLKDQAKKLLMKGKELKDPDIIQMALEMLESYEAPKEPAPVKKKVVKQAKPVAKKLPVPATEEFVMNPLKQNTASRRTPLERKKRPNAFTDDGSQFVELMGQTPPAQEKRKRKVNKKNVQCRVCGKKEKVLASLIMTDSAGYRCDECILKGRYGD